MTPNNNNKIYTKKANPNASNSELDAKKVIKIPKDNINVVKGQPYLSF